MNTTTHAYSTGDHVTTAEFGTMPLVITHAFPDGSSGYCGTCDNHGSACCPGPFYLAVFLDGGNAQNDPAIYAEHELQPANA